jgi:hypothetical protein
MSGRALVGLGDVNNVQEPVVYYIDATRNQDFPGFVGRRIGSAFVGEALARERHAYQAAPIPGRSRTLQVQPLRRGLSPAQPRRGAAGGRLMP